MKFQLIRTRDPFQWSMGNGGINRDIYGQLLALIERG